MIMFKEPLKRTGKMANNFIKVGKWGECLWGIDEDGTLLIDRGEAVSLGSAGTPWKGYEAVITSAMATRRVSFPEGTSLAGLFKGCKKMVKADLSGFDTSNVSRMDSMFEGCAKIEIGMKDMQLLLTYIQETLGGEIPSRYQNETGEGRLTIL
jgi:surface protein